MNESYNKMTAHATVWLPYTQMQNTSPPLEVVATKNFTLTLSDGTHLIDSVASWWTACHGYNHPHILKAISEQIQTMPHMMLGGCVHPPVKQLSQQLAQKLPHFLNHFFYSESGSVAIEIAMKMALQYWINQKEVQRQHFLCFEYGYHGDTFFAMSVADPLQGFHRYFQGVLPKQFCQPLPTTDVQLESFEAWLKKNAHCLAGMLIEPLVQAAGGMKMHSPDKLKAIGELCRQYNLLVIFDEVFTGFGRTGSFFAFEQSPFVPDILCFSKALTGGTLPLAVTIANRTIYEAFLGEDPTLCLMHGASFMGNPTACRAAMASLELFETEPRLDQVADIAGFLKSALTEAIEIPGVKDVRTMGAIGVIQLKKHITTEQKNWFKQQFLEDGIWSRPFEDIIYTTPAFTIEKEALEKISRSMIKQVKGWSKKFYCNE